MSMPAAKAKRDPSIVNDVRKMHRERDGLAGEVKILRKDIDLLNTRLRGATREIADLKAKLKAAKAPKPPKALAATAPKPPSARRKGQA
jgi:uncharacterized coiled-coil DUF342 family protein